MTRKDTKVSNMAPRIGFTCYYWTDSGQCKMVVLDLKRHLIKTHKMDQLSEAFEELIQRSIDKDITERSIHMKRSLDKNHEERPNGPRKYVSDRFEFDSEDSNCHLISKPVSPGLSKESSSAFHSEIAISPSLSYDIQIPSSSQQALPPILQTPCHENSSNALSFVTGYKQPTIIFLDEEIYNFLYSYVSIILPSSPPIGTPRNTDNRHVFQTWRTSHLPSNNISECLRLGLLLYGISDQEGCPIQYRKAASTLISMHNRSSKKTWPSLCVMKEVQPRSIIDVICRIDTYPQSTLN